MINSSGALTRLGINTKQAANWAHGRGFDQASPLYAISPSIALRWQQGDRGIKMDVTYISALSALAGSVIGGMTSGITTWLNQRSQLRSNQIAHDISRREELYKEFILVVKLQWKVAG